MSESQKERRRSRRGNGSSIVTKESVFAVFGVFSLLSFLMLCTNDLIFGAIGGAVRGFLTGAFGFLAYPIILGIFYLSFMGLIGKRLVRNRKAGACIVFTIIFLALIVHTATTYTWDLDGYMKRCFDSPTSEEGSLITVAGWVGALPVWGCAKILTKIGALVVFSVLALTFGYLSYVAIHGRKNLGVEKSKKHKSIKETETPVEIPLMQPTSMQDATGSAPVLGATVDAPQQPGVVLGGQASNGRSYSPFGNSQSGNVTASAGMEDTRSFLFGKSARERYQDNLIFDPTSKVNNRPRDTFGQPVGVSYTDSYQNSVNEQPSRPEKIVTDFSTPMAPERETVFTPVQPVVEPFVQEPVQPSTNLYTPVEPILDRTERETPGTFTTPREELFGRESTREFSGLLDESPRGFEEQPTRGFEEYRQSDESKRFNDYSSTDRDRSALNIFDEEDTKYSLRDDFGRDRTERNTYERETRGDDLFGSCDSEELNVSRGRDELDVSRSRDDEIQISSTRDDFLTSSRDSFVDSGREERSFGTPMQTRPEPVAPTPPPPPPKPRIIRPYVQPRLDDFTCTDILPTHDPEEEEQIKNNIIHTLEDHKVTDATVVSTTHGPTVTRYNVAITRDTLPQKVIALEPSLAMSLQSSLVSVAPNYDNGTISIEVPNKNRQFVNLGSMLSGDTFVNAKPSSLMFTMGKDVFNAKVYGDLSKMVHLLVAGGTGGGKSVFLGAMIMSLIYKYSPQELRLILIDPKKTEFSLYYNLPHLMINEIITDSKKTVRALNWAEGEMNRRYELLNQMTKSGKFVQNVDQFNSYVEKENKLPKIVIIIDELADLMLTSERKEIEDRIQSLTQKARAAGIHVVVATQRPSTNVITGVIKTNLTTRIAFSVPTDVDSRVILDHTGAQNLCGLGDMLYFISGMKSPVRVQSPFIKPEEAQQIVNFIKENNEAYYDEEATAYINDDRGGGEGVIEDNDEFDPVYVQALRYVILSNTASISLVQRKCSVGYNKAGKIIDWMDNKGYITPFDGAKARKVLITKEQFEELYGPF